MLTASGQLLFKVLGSDVNPKNLNPKCTHVQKKIEALTWGAVAATSSSS